MTVSNLLAVATPQPPTPPRQKFTAQEDALLRALVQDCQTRNWQTISLHFPGRTARQCRERYKNHLCQGHVRRNWTAIEDRTIQQAQLLVAQRWAIIAKLLPGRRCLDVKNRWYHHIAIANRPRTFQDDLLADLNPPPAKQREVVTPPDFPQGPNEIGEGLFIWNNIVGRQLEREDED
jgi:hypothetical protein